MRNHNISHLKKPQCFGEHRCLIYETEQEYTASTTSFIISGLELGGRVHCITTVENKDAVIKHLDTAGVNLVKAETLGYIVFHHVQSFFQDNIFEPSRIIASIISLCQDANTEGLPGIFIAIEMSWLLNRHIGSKRLAECEERLNREVFALYPVTSLCQYNRNLFSPEFLSEIILTHPCIMIGSQSFRNPSYPRNLPAATPYDYYQEELNSSTILDQVKDAVIAVDHAQTIIFWSKSAEKIYGFSAREVIGRKLSEIKFCDCWFPQTTKSLESLVTKGEWRSNEIHLTRSGQKIFIRASYSVLKNADNNPIGLLGVMHDCTVPEITEPLVIKGVSKNTEKLSNIDFTDDHQTTKSVFNIIDEAAVMFDREMKHPHHLAYQIIENMTDPVLVLDRRGTIMYASPSNYVLLGRTRNDLLGCSILEYLHPSEHLKIKAELKSLISSGTPRTIEVKFRHKNGNLIWLETNAIPIIEEDGTINKIVLSGRDITERKRVDYFKLLAIQVFKNVCYGLLVADEDGIIQMTNPAFVRITGYDEDILLKKSLFKNDFFIGMPNQLTQIISSLDQNDRWDGIFLVQRNDGHRFKAIGSVTAVREPIYGKMHYIVTIRDPSEDFSVESQKKLMQEQMDQAQRLASLSTISAAVVHEIIQPLNTIKLLSDGIIYWKKKKTPLDQEAIISSLEEISHEVSRINELLSIMRSFGKTTDTLKLNPCNINDAVRGALNIMGRQLAAHGITVNLRLEENLPLILGEKTKIEESIINLLSNAMDALDETQITHKHIWCITSFTANTVTLEIADNGGGIDPQVMNRIFEPFFTTKPGGTGLGLPIVESIITSFNGFIETSNNDYKGASFKIILPIPDKELKEQKS